MSPVIRAERAIPVEEIEPDMVSSRRELLNWLAEETNEVGAAASSYEVAAELMDVIGVAYLALLTVHPNVIRNAVGDRIAKLVRYGALRKGDRWTADNACILGRVAALDCQTEVLKALSRRKARSKKRKGEQ